MIDRRSSFTTASRVHSSINQHRTLRIVDCENEEVETGNGNPISDGGAEVKGL
ncbi:hypothetical protein Ddye_005570 [Dipteronia dyeriana]|uniref:Uncharacterized protein n=1 Tax=Dipteronia dyeriana TaxID=168575 RepID=A0AAE0CPT9_9ROSI|nr:hypothetical protein Ddye_005570 [Dipteronia dyeriana]